MKPIQVMTIKQAISLLEKTVGANAEKCKPFEVECENPEAGLDGYTCWNINYEIGMGCRLERFHEGNHANAHWRKNEDGKRILRRLEWPREEGEYQ